MLHIGSIHITWASPAPWVCPFSSICLFSQSLIYISMDSYLFYTLSYHPKLFSLFHCSALAILYISCPSPSYFAKKPQFLYWRTVLETQVWALGCPRCFQTRSADKQGNMCVYANPWKHCIYNYFYVQPSLSILS